MSPSGLGPSIQLTLKKVSVHTHPHAFHPLLCPCATPHPACPPLCINAPTSCVTLPVHRLSLFLSCPLAILSLIKATRASQPFPPAPAAIPGGIHWYLNFKQRRATSPDPCLPAVEATPPLPPPGSPLSCPGRGRSAPGLHWDSWCGIHACSYLVSSPHPPQAPHLSLGAGLEILRFQPQIEFLPRLLPGPSGR